MPRAGTPRRLILAAFLAGALPARFHAAETRKRRLGFLGIGDGKDFFGDREMLLAALGDAGYVLGRNLEVDECYEMESPEKLAECARGLSRRQVEIIVTMGTTSTLAAQKATRTIPIVTSVGDPVAAGFTRSLRRPDGNITGLTQNRSALARKQLELLKMMRPKLSAIALTWEPPFPGAEILMQPVIEAAKEASVSTHEITRKPNGFGKTLAEMKRLHIEAAYPVGGLDRRELEAAIREHVAILASGYAEVELGALLSVEPDPGDDFRRAASCIDKLLKGASPAEIPFESSTRYITTINAKTAAALGIRLTPELRLRADRVIE